MHSTRGKLKNTVSKIIKKKCWYLKFYKLAIFRSFFCGFLPRSTMATLLKKLCSFIENRALAKSQSPIWHAREDFFLFWLYRSAIHLTFKFRFSCAVFFLILIIPYNTCFQFSCNILWLTWLYYVYICICIRYNVSWRCKGSTFKFKNAFT